jgi:hypothetical protein
MSGVTHQCGLCARPIREGEPWSHEPQGPVHMACWKARSQARSAQLDIPKQAGTEHGMTSHAPRPWDEPDDWNSWSPGSKRVSECVLIGTSEPAPPRYSVCTIVFGQNDKAIKPHDLGAAVHLHYEDTACLELSGPGEVKSGGGSSFHFRIHIGFSLFRTARLYACPRETVYDQGWKVRQYCAYEPLPS